jgi:hypothetical protein
VKSSIYIAEKGIRFKKTAATDLNPGGCEYIKQY